MLHIFLVIVLAVELATPYLPFQYALPILPWLLHLRSGEAHTLEGKPLLLTFKLPDGGTKKIERLIEVFEVEADGLVTWLPKESRPIGPAYGPRPFPGVESDTELAETLRVLGTNSYSDRTLRMTVRFQKKDLTVAQLMRGLRRLQAAAAKGGVGLAVELKPE